MDEKIVTVYFAIFGLTQYILSTLVSIPCPEIIALEIVAARSDLGSLRSLPSGPSLGHGVVLMLGSCLVEVVITDSGLAHATVSELHVFHLYRHLKLLNVLVTDLRELVDMPEDFRAFRHDSLWYLRPIIIHRLHVGR